MFATLGSRTSLYVRSSSRRSIEAGEPTTRNPNLPMYFSRNSALPLVRGAEQTVRRSVSRGSDFTSSRKRVRFNSRASRVHFVGAVESREEEYRKHKEKRRGKRKKGE